MKWIFYTLTMLIFIGCAKTEINIPKKVVVDKPHTVKKVKLQKPKVNICDNISSDIESYKLSLSKKKNLHNLVDDYYKISNEIKSNNCKLTLENNSLKNMLVNNFIKANRKKYKKYNVEVKQLLLDIFKIHQKNLLNIATNYSEEMNEISLFTTDEENWEQYLETPLRDEVKLINNEFLYEIDNYRLNLLVQTYKNFISFSEQYNFAFSAENNPNYKTKIKSDFSIKDINIDKSDEDVFRSSFVNVITEGSDLFDERIGMLIDVADIAASALDIKIRGNENFKKARGYIDLILIDYQIKKLSEVKKDVDEQKKYLKKYFKNMIIMEEIK